MSEVVIIQLKTPPLFLTAPWIMLLHAKPTHLLSPSDPALSAFKSHTNPVGSVAQASTFATDAFKLCNKSPAADPLPQARP